MSIFDTLFGPLGKEYCVLFLVISAIALLALVVTVLYGISVLARGNKLGMTIIPILIVPIITYGIAYLQGRLLYNICGKTL